MFENVIGHIKNKKILEDELTEHNISQSYLFCGKDGIGKKLIALDFAREILNVENLSASADFKYISRQEGKKDIVVEQVRSQIIDDIYIVPSQGNKKVYVIDDAECLNLASQNALLKTLEEPPSYVVIILIASNISAFLPTVISRLNVLQFDGVSDEELLEYINKKFDTKLSVDYIDFFEGSIGQAETMIKDNSIEKLEFLDKLLLFIKQKDTLSAFSLLENIDFNNKNIIDYLEYILYKNNYYSSVPIVEKAKQRLKYNGNYDIVVDSMILKIIDSI